MVERRILIFGSFLLALLGSVSAYGAISKLPYIITTIALFVVVGIGGLMNYTRQEIDDLREIYKERDKILKHKIEALTEELIAKEKNIIESKLGAKRTSRNIGINMPE
jgi:hypothetical protein